MCLRRHMLSVVALLGSCRQLAEAPRCCCLASHHFDPSARDQQKLQFPFALVASLSLLADKSNW